MKRNNFNLFLIVLFAAPLSGWAAGAGTGGGGDDPGFVMASSERNGGRCEAGEVTYHVEDITPWRSSPTWAKVKYICVDGRFFRNGVVPRYPSCRNGDEKTLVEDITPWGHETLADVKYVCENQRWKRQN